MGYKIITVENLGKKYILTQQRREPYTALRDVMAEKTKNLGRRVVRLFSTNRPSSENSTHEEFWALKGVSFEVKRGERIGIIGRNGAGKSTLLKILSRITEPSEGRVRIKGRMSSLLEVGTGFHPELTGRENIFLNGAILGMSKMEIREKFDEIVAFAEVEKFLDTPVKRFSSGMQVRLAFAVAAHLEPEILVVDEVLAVGDAQFQKKCMGKMEDVSKEGRTILFVSHNMAALEALCTKAIWLRSGNIVGQGDVSEQINHYLNTDRINLHIFPNKSIQLGPDLQLRKIELSPNPILSMEKQSFEIELWSSRPARVESIAILIYSSLGIRVAILDLRSPNAPYQLDGMNPLRIRGLIKSLPLVEGDYRAGLYIESENTRNNFLDLVEISVKNKPHDDNKLPYPAGVRGVVELEFILHN
jgi:lipopolysaccharide transport system ATP-binding protein